MVISPGLYETICNNADTCSQHLVHYLAVKKLGIKTWFPYNFEVKWNLSCFFSVKFLLWIIVSPKIAASIKVPGALVFRAWGVGSGIRFSVTPKTRGSVDQSSTRGKLVDVG